jgi:hypothetical protein
MQLIDNSIVTYTQLEQSFQFPCERFGIGMRNVLTQPLSPLNDSPRHRLV